MSSSTLAVVLASAVRRGLSERAHLVVRVAFYLVIIGVLSALWGAAVRGHGGSIAGYTWAAFVWYFVASEGSVVGVEFRLIDVVGSAIGSGEIASDMLRPVSVLSFRASSDAGSALVRCAFMLAGGALFALIVAGVPPSVPAALLAVPSAALAVAVNVVSSYAFAGIAFWIEDSKVMWFLYQKLIFLVGGMLIPLRLLPGWLRVAAWFTPFWSMSYAPARLASGHFEPWLLAGQAAWLGVAYALATAVFARGERKLVVAGG